MRFFSCGRPHFLCKKLRIFEIYGVSARTRGLNQCRQGVGVNFSRFGADVFYGRPLMSLITITFLNLFLDLQTVMKRLQSKYYTKLSDLVGDVSLIFDNCRQYNGPESNLVRCAEMVETVFVGKIRDMRGR